MVEVERLSHFRKDFDIKINLRELLLRHPGIFYVSTKGLTQTVILRESYSKGCLVEPDPIYDVRRKMLDLVLLGRRNSRELRLLEDEFKEKNNDIVLDRVVEGPRLGDWVIPILDKIIEHDSDGDTKNINDLQWDLTD
ncbi:hypothetical protein QJS10_CPB17g01639 [Acorus calamus]|uniref:PORR domain-containing protein n=1 Tax=Acorus calamus TaxID=4465 RepID=A0AAV9CWD4_ACOCL|nr:hypothetical protein QJS10_CPB17g01639 [Acorus calamus]